jgi:hypothetical protein
MSASEFEHMLLLLLLLAVVFACVGICVLGLKVVRRKFNSSLSRETSKASRLNDGHQQAQELLEGEGTPRLRPPRWTSFKRVGCVGTASRQHPGQSPSALRSAAFLRLLSRLPPQRPGLPEELGKMGNNHASPERGDFASFAGRGLIGVTAP